MSGEEDATREIFGYTSHIPVPTWVDKAAYSACKHCQVKFSALKEQTKQHHCRLCGDMFCGSCTGKYHVPLVYEMKGKKGATRVCIRCRDSCLKQKESEKNAAIAQQPQKHAVLSSKDLSGNHGTASVRPSQFVGGPTPIEIAPPTWDDPDKFVECAKCHKKGGKPHNCRTCGHLFCDTCTSKMLLPSYFEKKKKVGPARVCGECRFKILGGAKLVERLSTDLPDLDAASSSSNGPAGGKGSATTCIAPGCTGVRVSKNGYCATHVNEFGTGGSDLATSHSIAVRWEGSAATLTRVALTDKHMNLLQIDHAFKRQVPEFAKRDDFEYVYKSEGIAEVFLDLFNATHFQSQGNLVCIRKKVDTDLLVAQYARQGVSGRATASMNGRTTMAIPVGHPSHPDAATAAAVSTGPTNPFKRRDTSSVPVPAKTKAAAPVARVFHKPGKLARIDGNGVAAGGKKVPPPPPASGGGGPPPLAGVSKPPPPPAPAGSLVGTPEIFKQRAKQYFGAL